VAVTDSGRDRARPATRQLATVLAVRDHRVDFQHGADAACDDGAVQDEVVACSASALAIIAGGLAVFGTFSFRRVRLAELVFRRLQLVMNP